MTRTILSVLLSLLVLHTNGAGVALDSTPVQNSFEAQLAGYEPRDEDFNVGADERREEGRSQAGKRSVAKAALLSGLLPGLGQRYLGDRKNARYFFVAEGVVWVGFLSFSLYSDMKKDDYYDLAAIRANTNLEGKSEAFIDAVGFYDNVDDYNTAGRIIEPDRPYYDPMNKSTSWRWEREADRKTYRGLKNRSEEASRRAGFALGAAVANRVISVVDAILKGRRMNRKDDEFSVKTRIKLRFTASHFVDQQTVVVSYYFGN